MPYNSFSGYNRMSSQKAKNDLSLESKIGQFVFANFWKRLGAKDRVEDKYLQIHGIDVQVGSWNIDEKCKYYDSKTKGFMTELLNYPSFEASMVNQAGKVQIGWFLNESNLTTHYAFIQPFSNQPNPKDFKIDDLIKVNILLVSRKDLDWIKNSGNLYDKSLELRNNYKLTNEKRMRFPSYDFWMTYTPTFKEQPVNIVVPRNVLKSLPNSREFELFPNGKLVELKQ